MVALLLCLAALAADDDEAPVVALEGNATVSLPGAGLGLGPGLRLAVEHPFAEPEGLTLGAEGDLRLPSSGTIEVSDAALEEDLELRTRLTLLGLGARVGWIFGEVDKVRGRVALGVGVGLGRVVTEGPAGDTVEGITTLWLRPQGGVLIPAGPGDLTVTALVGLAPGTLEVADGDLGGVALGVGYRIAL